MERRRFGTYGSEVPVICFGTMRFASKGRADDDVSRAGKRALEVAIERGIDFVHSSYEYGTRWAVGDVLARHPKRDRVRHAIKVNVPDWGVATFAVPSTRSWRTSTRSRPRWHRSSRSCANEASDSSASGR